MVGQEDFLAVGEVGVVADGGVDVEEERQVEGLVGVDQLVLETEALDFVEIEGRLLGVDLVDGDACDGSVGAVEDLVEAEGGLARIDDDRRRGRLELPWDLVLRVAHEGDPELPVHVDLTIFELVLFSVLAQSEAEGLADDVVEGVRQEVAAEQKENNSVNAVELAPLRFLPEDLVHLRGLSTLPHLQGQALVVGLVDGVQRLLALIIGVDLTQVDPLDSLTRRVLLLRHIVQTLGQELVFFSFDLLLNYKLKVLLVHLILILAIRS